MRTANRVMSNQTCKDSADSIWPLIIAARGDAYTPAVPNRVESSWIQSDSQRRRRLYLATYNCRPQECVHTGSAESSRFVLNPIRLAKMRQSLFSQLTMAVRWNTYILAQPSWVESSASSLAELRVLAPHVSLSAVGFQWSSMAAAILLMKIDVEKWLLLRITR